LDDTQCVRWNDFSWLRSNRPLLIAEIVGTPLVVAWLLFAYLNGHNTFALVIVALLPFFVVANLVIINRARGRLADPATRRDSPTGQIVAPVLMQLPPDRWTQGQRWTGAADVPGSTGRINASVPLGVLELSGGVLTLRVRPRFLAAMFGAKPLIVAPAEVDAIFPARGRLRSSAIGIRPHGAPPSYFLVGRDRAPILSAVAAAGFPVQWEERSYSSS
jgi:hypothetical protein